MKNKKEKWQKTKIIDLGSIFIAIFFCLYIYGSLSVAQMIDASVRVWWYEANNISWKKATDESYEAYKKRNYRLALKLSEIGLEKAETDEEKKQSLSMISSIYFFLGNTKKSKEVMEEKIQKYGAGTKLGPATEMGFDRMGKTSLKNINNPIGPIVYLIMHPYIIYGVAIFIFANILLRRKLYKK